MGSFVCEKDAPKNAFIGGTQDSHDYATDVIVRILGVGVKRIIVYPDETQVKPIHEIHLRREDLLLFEGLLRQHEQGRCKAEEGETYMDPIDWERVWNMMEVYCQYMREHDKEEYLFYAVQ